MLQRREHPISLFGKTDMPSVPAGQSVYARKGGRRSERRLGAAGRFPVARGHPENCGKAGESSIFDKNIAEKSFYYFIKITGNNIDFFAEM